MRVLAPAVRSARPPDTLRFRHYMTEHGFRPDDLGVRGRGEARRAKEKFLLRAPLLWLNKGISALYVYKAYDGDELGFGVFDSDGNVSTAMRTLHELTGRLADAMPIAQPRQLTIDLGDHSGPSAAQENLLAVLPFQVTDRKFALAAYLMTRDFPADRAAQPFAIRISGLRGSDARITYFSPEARSVEPVRVLSRTEDGVTVELPVTDVPKLLEIEELPPSDGTGEAG